MIRILIITVIFTLLQLSYQENDHHEHNKIKKLTIRKDIYTGTTIIIITINYNHYHIIIKVQK